MIDVVPVRERMPESFLNRMLRSAVGLADGILAAPSQTR